MLLETDCQECKLIVCFSCSSASSYLGGSSTGVGVLFCIQFGSLVFCSSCAYISVKGADRLNGFYPLSAATVRYNWWRAAGSFLQPEGQLQETPFPWIYKWGQRMSQYSDPKSTRMEPAVSYEEEDLDGRDALRKGIWYQALDNVQYQRGESLPSEEQRWQKQVALRMPFLGEQPLDEWVKELEHRVWQELWLEDAYQALWWYMAQYIPWTAEHDKPEGEEFDGSGLLWESFAEPDFGSPAQNRLQDIFYEREARHDGDDPHEVEQDLAHLATLEWELEQDYRDLFHSIGKAQQDSKVTDPVPDPFRWEDIIEICWEEPQAAGGDGTEVSPPVLQGIGSLSSIPQREILQGIGSLSSIPQREILQGIGSLSSIPQREILQGIGSLSSIPQRQAELQGAEVVVPAPQQQRDFSGIGSPVSIPQWQYYLLGIGSPVSSPQRQSNQQGTESPVSFLQQQDSVLGGETVGLPPLRRKECMGEELTTTSPQRRIINGQGIESSVSFPQQQSCVTKGETVGLQQQDCISKGETVGLPLQQPGFNQATLPVALATGQSDAGLCPCSTPPSQRTRTQHSRGEAPGHGQASPLPSCSNYLLWVGCAVDCVLWVGCWTNKGTDRQEVRYPVSLFGKGERCDETNLATLHWRNLVARLLPLDYGPLLKDIFFTCRKA